MGLYIKAADVSVRVRGKVAFTDDPEDENKMSYALLNKLINEAEADVEQDLSVRYAAPFQTPDGCPFASLPERPTKQFLRTLCELKAVMRVLETDFGSGTAVGGDKYYKTQDDRYKAMVDKITGKLKDSHAWKYPPLDGLRLMWGNELADDGFNGQVLSTDSGVGNGGYAANQINSPSQSFWTGDIDGCDNTTF